MDRDEANDIVLHAAVLFSVFAAPVLNTHMDFCRTGKGPVFDKEHRFQSKIRILHSIQRLLHAFSDSMLYDFGTAISR